MEKKLLKRFEEMDDTERNKMKQLLKDKKSGDDKLTWMYKDKADSEEYLLGRRVDGGVVEPEPVKNDSAGALFSEVITRRSELDMQVKMREDPLYAIRKREEEAKRRLLENPIKMKQLQKALEQKQQEKKKKKKKKHKHKSGNSSDDELLQMYLAVVKHKKHADAHTDSDSRGAESSDRKAESRGHVTEHTQNDSGGKNGRLEREDCKRERSETDSDRKRHCSERDYHKSDSSKTGHKRDHSERAGHSRERSERDKYKPECSESDRSSRHRQEKDRRSGRDSVDREKHRHSGSEQEQVDRGKPASQSPESSPGQTSRPKPTGYGLITSSRSEKHKPATGNSESTRDRSIDTTAKLSSNIETTSKNSVASKSTDKLTAKPPVKRKLTEAEMEEKRAEMMRNAEQRDMQRLDNVKRYKAEDDREARTLAQQSAAASFVKPLMMKHADDGSVEDRIKRNVYKIQRTSNDLDKNFTKR